MKATNIGERVVFNFSITNLGATETGELIVRDTYDAGLLFERPDNPVETTIASIPPGSRRAPDRSAPKRS